MTSPVPAPSPARHGRRRVLLRLFWLALAVILLWLTLRSVPLGEVWDRLRRLQPWQIALLVVVNAAVLATFSARWWLLLRAQGYTVPYHALVGYRLATFAISYFTPGPHFGGEPLQVYVVTARHAVPVAVSIAAVVMDKVLEMLANFTFLAFGVLVVFHQQVLPGQGQVELLAASVLLLLLPGSLLVALALGLHPVSGLLRAADITWQRLFSPISLSTRVLTETTLYRTIRQSEEQSTALCRDHPFILLLAAAASLLSWLAIIGEFWLMTGVLGLESDPAGGDPRAGGGACGDSVASAGRSRRVGGQPGAGHACSRPAGLRRRQPQRADPGPRRPLRPARPDDCRHGALAAQGSVRGETHSSRSLTPCFPTASARAP